jgi:ATP-dependent Clp protease ATP-binding subunit ClpA
MQFPLTRTLASDGSDILALAWAISERYGRKVVTPEDVLLAIGTSKTSNAFITLNSIGADIPALMMATLEKSKSKPVRKSGFDLNVSAKFNFDVMPESTRLALVRNFASREAVELGSDHVDSLHLLLGILCLQDENPPSDGFIGHDQCPAKAALIEHGINVRAILDFIPVRRSVAA